MLASIHGPPMTNVAKTATSFGMKDSVASLICVAAWKMLITSPNTRATSSSGAAINRVILIACVPSVMTVSGVMRASLKVEALGERADQELPAIGQHKQHQLERQGDGRRGHHHHAHGHKNASHYEVDDQERDEDGEPYLECRLELADHEGGEQHAQGNVFRALQFGYLGQTGEKGDIVFARLLQHEGLQRRHAFGQCGFGTDLVLRKWPIGLGVHLVKYRGH